jgi:hypothetical protein
MEAVMESNQKFHENSFEFLVSSFKLKTVADGEGFGDRARGPQPAQKIKDKRLERWPFDFAQGRL